MQNFEVTIRGIAAQWTGNNLGDILQITPFAREIDGGMLLVTESDRKDRPVQLFDWVTRDSNGLVSVVSANTARRYGLGNITAEAARP